MHRTQLRRLQDIGAPIGFVLGLILIAAALFVLWLRHEDVATALLALQSPDPVMIALLLGGIFINVLLTGVFFGVLLSKYGNVRMAEMIAVLSVATMLNFLPMQPGLFARLAYHKTANAIALRDSVKVQFQALGISTATSAGIIVLLIVCHILSIGIIVPIALVTAMTAAASLFLPGARHFLIATVIRLLELATWAARYFAAFTLLGLTIDIPAATALACVSMVVSLVPMFGNGMGIREWTIGALSPYLTPNQVLHGLTAEFVNRAAEIVVIAVCGLIALAWLARYRRTIAQNQSPQP